MSTLLLELLVEEIPARMQKKASDNLKKYILDSLKQNMVEVTNESDVEVFITPRRFGIIIENLPKTTQDKKIEKKGPATNATPQAIEGFLKSINVTNINECEIVDNYYIYKGILHGSNLKDIIKKIIEDALNKITWDKSMKWNPNQSQTWVRPLRNILCMLDDNTINVEFLNLTANNYTFGHRFMSPNKIIITNPKDYKKELEKAAVIIKFEDRLEIIKKQITEIANSHKLIINDDKNLISEIAGLTEYPVSYVGKIDNKFMHLPEELLILVMKTHQRYIALRNQDGSLSNYFIIVANIKPEGDASEIIKGNERVLRARFFDGDFLYNQDKKIKLEDRVKKLNNVEFFKNLGTMQDKANRISEIAYKITNLDSAKRAALLAKADLVSEVVFEFPELQGIMGGYYAKNDGEPEEIIDTIKQHYKPIGPSDSLPQKGIPAIVAIADKLDTLSCFFSIGLKPASGSDPYALRRSALGIIRILIEHEYEYSLKNLIEIVSNVLNKPINDELSVFFIDRITVLLKEKFEIDIINAVSINLDLPLKDNINRISSLSNIFSTKEGSTIRSLIKRVHNIADINLNKSYNTNLLKLTEEIELAQAIEDCKNNLKNATLITDKYMALLKLETPLTNFFNKVMVNDNDELIKNNRHAMLNNIISISNELANFSKLKG